MFDEHSKMGKFLGPFVFILTFFSTVGYMLSNAMAFTQ